MPPHPMPLDRSETCLRQACCGSWNPRSNSQPSGGKFGEEIELGGAQRPEVEAELHDVLGRDVGELLRARRRIEFDMKQRIGAVITAVMLGVAVEERGAHDMSPLSIGWLQGGREWA